MAYSSGSTVSLRIVSPVGKLSFAADIHKHGRIVVTAFVGLGHSFLADFGIAKRGDVHVYRNISAR